MGNLLKDRLFKTRQTIFGRIKNLITAKGVAEGLRGELEEILITSDISANTVQSILKNSIDDSKCKTRDGLIDAVKGCMLSLLTGVDVLREKTDLVPMTSMIVGVNGVGKTTTIAKMASLKVQEGKRVLLAACDTFRAAAVEQLLVWGDKIGCRVIKNNPGADPASVAFDALGAAIAGGYDFLILDTAGRLHTKHNLMEELKKIKRVLGKENSDFPQEILLVLDATFGQNTLSQIKEFNEALGLTGVIMTKMDGTAKGGTLLSVANEYRLPVKYIGVGEGENDLIPFNEKEFVEAIFS